MELNLRKKKDKDELTILSKIQTIKPNCKIGKFDYGGIMYDEIEIEIIAMKQIEAEMFKSPHQPWLIVVAADQNGYLKRIPFKTEGMDNLMALYEESTIEGNPSLMEIRLRVDMSPRAGRYGDYFAPVFRKIGKATRLDAVEQFLINRPPDIFRIGPPVVDGNQGPSQIQDREERIEAMRGPRDKNID